MQLVVSAPDQACCPVAILPRSIVGNRGSHPSEIARLKRLRMNQMAVRELHRPVRCWREPDSPAPRIELAHFNVFAVLIGFGAMEQRAFNTESPRDRKSTRLNS